MHVTRITGSRRLCRLRNPRKGERVVAIFTRLFLGEAHGAAVVPTKSSLEAQFQSFSSFLVAPYACGAENRSRLGFCQPVCFCLCENGFYASAPVQPDRPGSIFRFNLIVAIEGLAHTVSQILGKSLHPAPLTLTFDILNFQVCLHLRQYVHRGCNRVEACGSDERAYLEKEIVSQCLPEHLIPLPHATDSFRLGQRGHLVSASIYKML